MQLPPIIPLVEKIRRLAATVAVPTPISVTATSSTGSPTLTAAGALAGVAIGDTVTGPGITPPLHVIALDDTAHTVTLSGNAGAGFGTGTFVFTFPAGTALKFRLGQVNRSLNDAVTLAALVAEEATFDNYPAGGIALSMTVGYITPTRIPSDESQLLQFIMTINPPVTTNTIYYWWVDDGTNVRACQSFEAPIAMALFGAALKVMYEDSYPPTVPTVQVVP